ncbi:MAG: hypothetical protein ACRC46_00625 [Thermoguttaceae bacterium]
MVHTLNRAELVERLKKLAESATIPASRKRLPKRVQRRAMCYSPARIERAPNLAIPCPQCQKGTLTIFGKTLERLYPHEDYSHYDPSVINKVREKILKRLAKEPDFLKELEPVDFVHHIIAAYQEPFATLQELGLPAELIVPPHCSLCGHGFEEKKFVLRITYPDSAKPHKISLEGTSVLETMVLFLQGRKRLEGGRDEVKTLKEFVPKLRKWFGVTKSECEGV